MTICISAVCDINSSPKVIVAGDRMITGDWGPWQIEFEHHSKKVTQISKSCIVLSAGSALAPADLISEIKKISNPSENIKEYLEIAKKSFLKIRNKRIEELYFKPRNLSIEEFYGGYIRTLPPEHPLILYLDKRIDTYKFPIELLVAGVDKEGAHIYEIEDPGTASCFNQIGYHAIGSGIVHALSTFILFGYEPNIELKKALYIVYEAKKKAEDAPGVGKETDIAIIDSEKVRFLSEEEIDNLERIYQNKKAQEPKIGEFINNIDFLGKENGY